MNSGVTRIGRNGRFSVFPLYLPAKDLDRQAMGALSKTMVLTPDPSSWPVASKRKTALWAKLHTKKERQTTGRVIIEGVRLVSEVVLCGVPVDTFLAEDSPEGLRSAQRVLDQVDAGETPGVRVSPKEFGRLSDTVHHAGVGAVIQWRADNWKRFRTVHARRILFCDRIADPGNMGTLIRTAAGLGLQAVCAGPNSVELANPKTVRASAGAIFRIPAFSDVPVEAFIAWCTEHGYILFGADRNRGLAAIPEAARTAKGWGLVIGGETSGLDPAWSAGNTQWLRIPMKRGVESFNAAIAGAMLMDRLCSQSP